MDSSSPLAGCFGVVNPENAFHKCVNDMSNDVTLNEKNGPCKAAKAYELECGFAGVTVYEPKHCGEFLYSHCYQLLLIMNMVYNEIFYFSYL